MSTELPENPDATEDQALAGGSYEVIRRRLLVQAKLLGERAAALNARRLQTFGTTELSVAANARVRTENNCVPRDIVNVNGTLVLGFNVFLGLKTTTRVEDVFGLFSLAPTDDGYDLSPLPVSALPGLFDHPTFVKEFTELYQYYKEARLVQLRLTNGRLLALFQAGQKLTDIKAFRWSVDPDGTITYIDNRGEEDNVNPPAQDFEWVAATRDDQVSGRHPHISILDEVFVEMVGGDLTIKVEDNTEDGLGIYREPVDDPRQSLDDGETYYAKVGQLILLKMLPYRETDYRYLVFNTRTQTVRRLDAIGVSCQRLPEDHGIVFPGGYYLEADDGKTFDVDTEGMIYRKRLRAPNGEDVLFIFYQQAEGRYLLLPYNLINKEVATPLSCAGYSIAEDGRMLLSRTVGEEPGRTHPIQVWKTPFMSEEFAAEVPTDGSYLAKVGNAELVRGISEAYSLKRLADSAQPSRATFEELIAGITRMGDSHYWLESEDAALAEPLAGLRENTELIIDEFEKVQAMKARADEALKEAAAKQAEIQNSLRPDSWEKVSDFLRAMTELRTQRGQLITLKDLRYVDLARLDALEAEAVEAFDRVSQACVRFLLSGEALEPLVKEIEALLGKVEAAERVTDFTPLEEELEQLNGGLNLLSEVIGGLQIEDANQRTEILESISEVFGHLNRARAVLVARKKELRTVEGKAEFGAQFKLLGQAVSGSIALASTPDKCDEELSRLLIQLEDLEARFSEFDDFLVELNDKREEIYEAFNGKKQQLMDERQRRAENLQRAADRILDGVNRRSSSFKEADALNAYFAADPMIMKLRQLVEQLRELGDDVKADDIEARLKADKQTASRNLRDKRDLFAGGDNLIQLGKHQFTVNTQDFELSLVPREEGMALHLTGTELYEPIQDEVFAATREYWDQERVSERPEVYRAEYLAYCMLMDAQAQAKGLSVALLGELIRDQDKLVERVRAYAADRYDEGYERGVHDVDTARILEQLYAAWAGAGRLAFSGPARALALLYWDAAEDGGLKASLHRRSQSLARLKAAFSQTQAEAALAEEAAQILGDWAEAQGLPTTPALLREAGRYLPQELAADNPRFALSQEAEALKTAFVDHLGLHTLQRAFEEDLKALKGRLAERWALVQAWLTAFIDSQEGAAQSQRPALAEAAAWLLTERSQLRDVSPARTEATVEGLLGQHPRIQERKLQLRLDELLPRLAEFTHTRVPGFRAFREARGALLERERARLRLDEFKPRVLTSFVRNRLINEVYLPMIGDNLAKQLGAAGDAKRTDLMGLLLLISPPGYGKTTLMEYMASRLGMVFMKVNGPSLGHGVVSLDPSEAPNATARQEVEKINLAFEMKTNVMLYLDDIQHTNPELLQKFISLCDASRRIEGVYKGRTQTYDLRGKKFAVVMAGNPYTESGEKFQIPDMLANRADTYNLGDILDGKDDVFALSYLENSLTSNPVLAPVAARSLEDMHRFFKTARGEEVPAAEFEHSYSRVEVEEIQKVLRHLFVVQDLLLKVNMQYIESASQDDRFRTEPPFKLQGSYRNMNKLAEKVVAAMNPEELNALMTDHYGQEAQTLTAGAEQNLLKLAELRGLLTEAEAERWDQLKSDFRRITVAGTAEDDPVGRVTSTLGALSEQLLQIRGELQSGRESQALPEALAGLGAALRESGHTQQASLAQGLSGVGAALKASTAEQRAGLAELSAALGAASQRQQAGLSEALSGLAGALAAGGEGQQAALKDGLRALGAALKSTTDAQQASLHQTVTTLGQALDRSDKVNRVSLQKSLSTLSEALDRSDKAQQARLHQGLNTFSEAMQRADEAQRAGLKSSMQAQHAGLKSSLEALAASFRALAQIQQQSVKEGIQAVAASQAQVASQVQAAGQAQAGDPSQAGGQALAQLQPQLQALHQALTQLSRPQQLNVQLKQEVSPELEGVLTRQAQQLEATVLPLAQASSANLDQLRSLQRPVLELLELMKLNALNPER